MILVSKFMFLKGKQINKSQFRKSYSEHLPMVKFVLSKLLFSKIFDLAELAMSASLSIDFSFCGTADNTRQI